MGRFKDYKVLAAVLGILVAAGPVLWLSGWLQKQGDAEVSVTASWTVGNIDLQIGRAVAVLDALAARGVNGCGEPQLELLRRSLLTAGPVKELSVVSTHGQTLCTDRGSAMAPRDGDLGSADAQIPTVLLDVVQLGASDERMLRVRRMMSSSRGVAGGAAAGRSCCCPRWRPTAAVSLVTPALRSPTIRLIGVGGIRHGCGFAARSLIAEPRAAPSAMASSSPPRWRRDGAFATYDDLRRLGDGRHRPAGADHPGLAALIVPRRAAPAPFYEIERALGAGSSSPTTSRSST